MPKNIAIIGGGLMGLWSAYEILKQSQQDSAEVNVTIFEKQEEEYLTEGGGESRGETRIFRVRNSEGKIMEDATIFTIREIEGLVKFINASMDQDNQVNIGDIITPGVVRFVAAGDIEKKSFSVKNAQESGLCDSVEIHQNSAEILLKMTNVYLKKLGNIQEQ